MNACLVLVTHNRLFYTQKTIESLFADTKADFDLYIWDNSSTDATPDYLRSLKDNRIKDIIFRKDNLGPTAAMNAIWGATKAELVGKLDNDCLLSVGWVDKFKSAHRAIENLGAVACWHFRREDFDEKIAKFKIREYNGHQIFQHPWICGTGFLMKRQTYLQMGPWPQGSRDFATTDYFVNMAHAGYINGWYYPLVPQEHMDDPMSQHCCYYDDASLKKVQDITNTMRMHKIHTFQKRLDRRAMIINTLLHSPAEAKHFAGWRGKARTKFPNYDIWRWRTLRLFGQV